MPYNCDNYTTVSMTTGRMENGIRLMRCIYNEIGAFIFYYSHLSLLADQFIIVSISIHLFQIQVLVMVLLSTKNTHHKNVHMTGLLICTPSQCYLTYYLRVIRHVSQVFWYPSTNCFECQNSYLCPKELNQYNKFEGLFCPPAKETFSLLTGMGFQMRWQQCLFVKTFA